GLGLDEVVVAAAERLSGFLKLAETGELQGARKRGGLRGRSWGGGSQPLAQGEGELRLEPVDKVHGSPLSALGAARRSCGLPDGAAQRLCRGQEGPARHDLDRYPGPGTT